MRVRVSPGRLAVRPQIIRRLRVRVPRDSQDGLLAQLVKYAIPNRGNGRSNHSQPARRILWTTITIIAGCGDRSSIWLERRTVNPVIAGSNPVGHPVVVDSGVWRNLVTAPVSGTGDCQFKSDHADCSERSSARSRAPRWGRGGFGGSNPLAPTIGTLGNW